MRSGVLIRLVFCLGLLLGSGRTCAEEAHGRLEVNGSAEWTQAQGGGTGGAVDSGIGEVVEGDGANIERSAGSPGQSAAGDGNATKPQEGEAGDSADGTDGIPVMIGECTGKRFKKCR